MWILKPIQILICGFLIEVSGVLEWTVIGKVTDYGQNVTLFCKVPNCCPDDAGWDRWTPHQSTLFIDVKTGRSNKKYDGQVLRDGYTLIIQNLTKQDLNVSYSCLYGVTFGERKFLLEEDVFMHTSTTPPTGFSAGEVAAVITGVVVLLSVATFILWRRRGISHQNDQAEEPFLAKPSAPVGPISNITESSADIEWQTPDQSVAPPIDQYQNTPINSEGHGTSLESVDLTKLLRIIAEPSAPVGPMLISNITESSADIKWQTPEHNDGSPTEQYLIKYKLANTSAWENAGTVNGTTNRFTVKDLKEGQEYYFQVTPINSAGYGTSLESVELTKPKRIIKLRMKLSKDETKTYIEAIQSGKEVRQYVRIQVIGKDRVGKTSLVRRLLGYEKYDGTSTDGIEINRKCKIRTSDGEWILGKDETESSKLKTRIQKAVYDKQKGKEAGYEKASLYKKPQSKETKSENVPNVLEPRTVKTIRTETLDEPLEINNDENYTNIISALSNTNSEEKIEDNAVLNKKIKEKSKTKKMKSKEPTSDSFDLSRVNKKNVQSKKEEEITNLIIEKMDEILSDAKTDKDKMTEDGLVECGIWDFAGQKDYYATHQTFFTTHAIYLLVADIGDEISFSEHEAANFDTIGDYIDFWFNSIHCLCKDPSVRVLCPPVIMVCTGTDNIEEGKVEATKKEYQRKFEDTLGRHPKYNHCRGIHFISNVIPVEEEFRRLKENISNVAKEMNYFSEECPTRWINLEHALEVLKDSEMVYSWENILKLAKWNSIGEKELVLFLGYHHNIGNIIFFKDIPEFIILQPNWLVRCFRCLVCDDNKMNCTKSMTDFAKLKLEGVLSENLIGELFKKDEDLQFDSLKNHDFILAVMEQFDIIVNPKILISENKLYYMPCMISTTSTLKDIKTRLETQTAKCTPWLVLEFEFLPIACYNHILFNYIRKYTVCKEESGRLAIYSGKAVVSLRESGDKLLAICFSKNAIALQIWEWSPANNDLYESLLKDLCYIIDDFKRTAIPKLPYEIKAKCSTGDYSRTSGRIRDKDLNEQNKYFCMEHKELHDKDEIEKTWFKHASVTEEKKTLQKEKSNVKAEEIDMENTDMMDAVPSKKEMPGITNLKESNCNTGQGKISIAHLNQERYKISCGIAVVINNTEFDRNLNLQDRVGSDVDAASLFKGFQKLGFKSELLNNVSKEDMERKFDEIKEDKKSLQETDCLIVALMSHGNEEEVFLTDGSIKMTTFLSHFNAENCKELQMKPKIFIIQACRGTDLGGGVEMGVVKYKETIKRYPNQADAGDIYNEYDQAYGEPVRIHNAADFLVVYSTFFGYTAFRTTESGSPFVHHLLEELMNISKDDNFYQVLTRVNKKVGMGYRPRHKTSEIVTQMSCFSSHLTKELYFNLKGMADGSKLDVKDKDTSTTSSTTSSTTMETERNTGQGIINKSHLEQKMYTMRTVRAVVINNTEFDSGLGLADRSGSDVDASSLFQRFQELGFESDLLFDATLEDLEEKFQEIKDDKEELQKTDCLIVAVLSHGDEDNVYMTDTPVKIKAVMDSFNAQNCPELIQQPKVFIFQCSRGQALRDGVNLKVEAGKKENTIPYGLETVGVPNEADFLAVYSTSLGDISFDNTEGPSPFVYQLTKELERMKKEDDIYTVLTKVNNRVMRFEPGNVNFADIRQMPYFISHLTKDLYLMQMD